MVEMDGSTSIHSRWEDFTKAFCREFEPSEFEDSAEALFKLRQICILMYF